MLRGACCFFRLAAGGIGSYLPPPLQMHQDLPWIEPDSATYANVWNCPALLLAAQPTQARPAVLVPQDFQQPACRNHLIQFVWLR